MKSKCVGALEPVDLMAVALRALGDTDVEKVTVRQFEAVKHELSTRFGLRAPLGRVYLTEDEWRELFLRALSTAEGGFARKAIETARPPSMKVAAE